MTHDTIIETIKEIFNEHHIIEPFKAAAETAAEAMNKDENYDNQTYGFLFWKGWSQRITYRAKEDPDFAIHVDTDKQRTRLYVHDRPIWIYRVNPDTGIPCSGKALKKKLKDNCNCLPLFESDNIQFSDEEFLIGIVSNKKHGVTELRFGIISYNTDNSEYEFELLTMLYNRTDSELNLPEPPMNLENDLENIPYPPVGSVINIHPPDNRPKRENLLVTRRKKDSDK